MPVTATQVVQMTGGAVGYDDRPAIRDIDFTLDAGEVVALLGPNGAGKSTLVRGILGLAPLMAGTLSLFGVPAGQFHERYRLGYVPDEQRRPTIDWSSRQRKRISQYVFRDTCEKPELDFATQTPLEER